jgi:hypothetical protein
MEKCILLRHSTAHQAHGLCSVSTYQECANSDTADTGRIIALAALPGQQATCETSRSSCSF